MIEKRLCSVAECNKPQKARGLCSQHRSRWARHGDPLAGRTPNGDPERFFQEVVLPYNGDECLSWPYSGVRGYGVLYRKDGDCLVTRLVCEDEHGPPPSSKHHAAHSCGNGHGGCVSRKHLSWKTATENAADKLIHGTHYRGERHWLAKLTEPDVLNIRRLKDTKTQKELARMFNVTEGTIRAVLTGRSWQWLS